MPKTILITGSTDGIGKHLAMKLASEGHEVILHGRNSEKLRVALSDIQLKTGNKKIHGYLADFSKLADVYRFSQEIKRDFEQIDVLLNNAGAYFGDARVATAENIEMTFMLSVQVPYILTLLPLLEKAGGRVIHTSSFMHHFAQTRGLDFGLEQSYSAAMAYNNAKLYTIWLAISQAEALEKQGSSVTVNVYHPGLIATNLGNDGVKRNLRSRILTSLMKPFSRDLDQGIETGYYLSLSPEVAGQSGRYFSEKRLAKVSLKGFDVAKSQALLAYLDKKIQVFKESDRD
ncbi:SDR family NAD(P)-dependent oxidoreductase [Streptococcus suis]|uniref:Dehydrogenase n=1 Tax=Streptococcus suis TaxID=1307 RepID=A0A116NB39_STRSU|nr:SDR family NAD(P)-dependent oxidoreductase [Streptococcus suis]NQG58492.1 SDR family NAD(P)-dependent oxidoreductase [Streptococcus suis]NQH18390.1 SDR family NAD(P)-dependent oxidoreductase [Streptococcus suis]NQJ48213.1 SDR family NAD(P)-dependent oxidoreductase [Streptococcus suis]NQJ54424.1 SDR family NAD(P)-dependent oxidoreductase [Streptococcus suis]CYV29282.1 dehydrogenase [Streptococcus suis]